MKIDFAECVLGENKLFVSEKKIDDQFATVFFLQEDDSIYVDFIVSNTRDEATQWFLSVHTDDVHDDNIYNVSTGKVGLKGLVFALHSINCFISEQLKEGERLMVLPSDDRRRSAYKRLVKYGFTETPFSFEYSK